MASYNNALWQINVEFAKKLKTVADRYLAAQDARWLFARAHQLITQQIVDNIERDASMFRGPDALLRFNVSFASAFMAAVAGNNSAPWREAFGECLSLQVVHTTMMFPTDNFESFRNRPFVPLLNPAEPSAVVECSIAMADAHINTDILTALKTVGCIDPHDYGNMLLFVKRGSEKALSELTGKYAGATFEYLKDKILPLDRLWRNAVYVAACNEPVPDIEQTFIDAVDRDTKKMLQIAPAYSHNTRSPGVSVRARR